MKITVVGLGKLGYAISKALLDGGNDITIIDEDSERTSDANTSMDAYTILGDATDIEMLKSAGISDDDLLIACTENDERNLLICGFAKKLGCAKTMARVRSPQYVSQYQFIKETTGVDLLLNPDFACAEEMYKYLTSQYSLDGGKFTWNGMTILEFEIEKLPELIDKKLSEIPLSGLLVGAISRNGKIIIPNGSSTLLKGDIIYAVGLEKDINELTNRVQSKSSEYQAKRAMIAGGGKTGFFLAKMLEQKGVAVKILEKDKERCKYLSGELSDSVVLCADASNIDILREEGLEYMDSFIAATGFDEENLLLSLLVKDYKLENVVAKVSRQTFIPVIKNLGDIAVINPQEIIANNVLSFVRRNGIVLFSKLINGQAEFKEIQAESEMPLTKKTLMDLDIPEGVIILTVQRGKNIIIPNGKTQITSGDRVLLLTLLSSAGDLEALLTKTQTSIL